MSSAEVDFLKLDLLLSDEEKLARDSIRAFVKERVNPIIAECYEEGRFPTELIPELAKLGVLGSNLPEKYGCAGVNNVTYGLITQELEAGIRASAASPRFKVRSACTRSTPSAAKSSDKNICRGWPPAKS